MNIGILKKNKYPILFFLTCSLILLAVTAWPKTSKIALKINLEKIPLLSHCPLPKLKQTGRDLSRCGRLIFQATRGLCFMAKEQYKSHWIVFKNNQEAYTSLCVTLSIRHQKGLSLVH